MILGIFEHKFYFFCIKMEFQKIVNFLDTTSDENSERFPLKDLPIFTSKKWIEVYD